MRLYDSIPHLLLKVLRRKVYPAIFKSHCLPPLDVIRDIDTANNLIFNILSSKGPCMIVRYGGFELATVINYLYVSGINSHSVLKYIQGDDWEWWWNEHTLEMMASNAGFWPPTHKNAEKYAKLMLMDSQIVDITASMYDWEWYLRKELTGSKKIDFFTLEPFFSKNPWTRVLKGKKVLVVHPFNETIEYQYNTHRMDLFKNPDILPEFELVTLKAVQSLGGNPNYKDWFEALEYMEAEIDKIDFDIAILGCGAYAFNLAAHIKRLGKKAIQLGGVTQILFGIKGKRWENPVEQMCKNGYYPDLMNEYWCKPSLNERPSSANTVEGGCYW